MERRGKKEIEEGEIEITETGDRKEQDMTEEKRKKRRRRRKSEWKRADREVKERHKREIQKLDI